MNRLPFARPAAALAALLGTGLAEAHPGHGLIDAHSLLHGLEAEHLWPGLAVLALVGLLVRLQRRRGRGADRRSTPKHD